MSTSKYIQFCCSPSHFFTDNNQYKTILGAFWVTEGASRCCIGHVPENLKQHFGSLDGRLAQVYTIYHLSKDANKFAFSIKRDGVCHGILVDKAVANDVLLDGLVEVVDSASDSK